MDPNSRNAADLPDASPAMHERRERADFLRFREDGDVDALARVFDRTAPRLMLVAMHLCRDADGAEDLLQTTFLQAMERAGQYDESRPLMPWLVGILTHRGLDLRRQRQRHGRHQQALREDFDPDDLPRSALDLAADREVAAEVTAAIDGLAPKYRQVLILRLLHGLRPVDIAHAQGLSQDTVRAQLRRGLAMLRQRLPRGLSVPAIAVLLSSECVAATRIKVLAAAGRAPCAASAAGPWSQLASWPGLGLLLALGVLLWLLLPHAGEPAVLERPGVAVLAAKPGTSPAPVERAADPREALPEQPAAAASSPAPRWRVVWERDGRPAAGVSVQLRRHDALRNLTRPQLLRSDDAGLLASEDLAPGQYFLRRGPGEQVIARPGVDATLRLRGRAGLQGQVLDANGAAVVGAEVWISVGAEPEVGAVQTRSGVGGRFRLDGIGLHHFVAARAPGGAWSARYEVLPAADGVIELRLRLPAQSRDLGLQVLDPEGRPVAGAEVEAQVDLQPGETGRLDGTRSILPPPLSAQTDAQGRLTLRGLRRRAYQLRLRGPDLHTAPRQLRLAAEAAGPGLVMRLARARAVAGRVVDSQGRGVAGARVISGPLRKAMTRTTLTDAAGRFVLRGVTRDRLMFFVRHGQHGRARVGLAPFAGAEQELSRPIPLRRGVVAAGRLVDATGAPAGGLHLDVYSRGRICASGYSDGEGRFCILNILGRAPFELHVRRGTDLAPGLWRTGLGEAQLAAMGTLDFVPPAPARLRGQVRAVDGGAAPEGLVQVRASASSWRTVVGVDPRNGAFCIDAVPPGRLALRIVAPGALPYSHPQPIVAASGTELDLGAVQLAAGGDLLVELRGRPRPVQVVVCRPDGSARQRLHLQGTQATSHVGIAPGEVVVRALGAQREVLAERRCAIEPGAITRVELQLE